MKCARWGTTVPDPVGSYALLPRQSESKQQFRHEGRGYNSRCGSATVVGHNGSRQHQTLPSTPSSSWRKQPYRGGGREHNSTRPRRIIPSTLSSKQGNDQHQWGERGHSITRPRKIIPSTFPSNRRMLQNQERGRGHNSTRPRRITPSITSSKRGKTAASR